MIETEMKIVSTMVMQIATTLSPMTGTILTIMKKLIITIRIGAWVTVIAIIRNNKNVNSCTNNISDNWNADNSRRNSSFNSSRNRKTTIIILIIITMIMETSITLINLSW